MAPRKRAASDVTRAMSMRGGRVMGVGTWPQGADGGHHFEPRSPAAEPNTDTVHDPDWEERRGGDQQRPRAIGCAEHDRSQAA